jgi:hypothetical protein
MEQIIEGWCQVNYLLSFFCLRRPGALFIKTAPVREASAKIFYCDKKHLERMETAEGFLNFL